MWDGGTGTGIGTAPKEINPNLLSDLTVEEAARLLEEEPSESAKQLLLLEVIGGPEDQRGYRGLGKINIGPTEHKL